MGSSLSFEDNFEVTLSFESLSNCDRASLSFYLKFDFDKAPAREVYILLFHYKNSYRYIMGEISKAWRILFWIGCLHARLCLKVDHYFILNDLIKIRESF